MPRPATSARVVISGQIAGSESFAFGFWMDDTVTTAAAANTAAAAVASAFSTNALTRLAALLATDSSYLQVDYYGYTTATGAATFHGQASIASGTGTGTGSSLPYQCACVVTLHTLFAGRRHRGRMYVPVNSATLSQHQLTSTQIGNINGACQDFLSAVNASSSVPGTVAVISQVIGEETVVSSISVDSRVDIQRRRASGIAAAASTSGTI